MTVIIGIIIFCVIIIVHECGHFCAAKLFRMDVMEFSVGMGPKIFSRTKNGTAYSIRLLPIGGFVNLGEDNPDENTSDISDDKSDDVKEIDVPLPHKSENHFRSKPLWQRFIVIAAGAVMNLILGLIIAVALVASDDTPVSLVVNSPRDAAGSDFMAGDFITSVDGTPVFTASDFIYKLQNTPSGDETEDTARFDIGVVRGGKKLVIPAVWKTYDMESAGKRFLPDFVFCRINKTPANVLNYGSREALSAARMVIMTLADLARGHYGINDLSGPVGVVSQVGTVIKQNHGYEVQTALNLAMFISINVGVFNLIPLPALDGGRLFFFIVEALRRKPINPKYEGAVHFAGFAALMLLMVAVTVSDVVKLV